MMVKLTQVTGTNTNASVSTCKSWVKTANSRGIPWSSRYRSGALAIFLAKRICRSKSESCASRVRRSSELHRLRGARRQRPTKLQMRTSLETGRPCRTILMRASRPMLLNPFRMFAPMPVATAPGERRHRNEMHLIICLVRSSLPLVTVIYPQPLRVTASK